VDLHGDDNFPQGCSFSPDGLCIATATAADATLRLYNIVQESGKENDAEGGNGDDENDDENDNKQKEQQGGGGSEQLSPKKQPIAWKTALASAAVGEVIRCYDWYPPMQSSQPATCCLAATGRDQPVHLIDAYTGGVRATYVPMNNKDEMESPTVIQFSPAGDKIVTGGFKTERMLQIFDSARPGKTPVTNLKFGKSRRSSEGQKGLVSAFAFNQSSSSDASHSILAVGTYAPGSIYLYDFRQGCQQPAGTIWTGWSVVGHGKKYASKKRRLDQDNEHEENHNNNNNNNEDMFSAARTKWYAQRAQRGITQLEFDDRGMLYSASRKSDAILVWDVRMLSSGPEYASRPIGGYTNFATNALGTNQRLQFALEKSENGPSSSLQRLWAGGCDGTVRVYDTTANTARGGEALQTLTLPDLPPGDAVNGLSYNATYDLLAVATGSRRFPTEVDYYSDDSSSNHNDESDGDVDDGSELNKYHPPGSLRLYKWNT